MQPLLSLVLLLAAMPVVRMSLAAQTIPIRICTYNVLNHGDNVGQSRESALRRVITSIQPDILAVQEINGIAAGLAFVAAMDSITADQHVILADGPDTDNVFVFNGLKLAHVGSRTHPTALRNIDEHTLAVKETTDTLHVFVCHLKAGDAQSDTP